MAEPALPNNEAASGGEADTAFAPLAALADVSRRFGDILPVETWHPPFCGDIDMRIAKDGTWFYHGNLIERPALVRLFSRLLRKDDERYVLVTPAECVGIKVDDVPFVAADVKAVDGPLGQSLQFRTNVDDAVCADDSHPLRFETGDADGLIPYVLVRGRLWAKLTRALTIELVAYGSTRQIDGKETFGIASGGAFFPIAPAADVE